jgi:hypothetical protein
MTKLIFIFSSWRQFGKDEIFSFLPQQKSESWLYVPLFCRVCAMSVNIVSSFSLYCYMFRPNRPSSGVQVVVMKKSAAHCNALLLFLANCLGKQLVNLHNLELVRANYIREAEQSYSEQQIPSSQQPVHLMMAGEAETCRDNKQKNNRRCTQTASSGTHSATWCCNLILKIWKF